MRARVSALDPIWKTKQAQAALLAREVEVLEQILAADAEQMSWRQKHLPTWAATRVGVDPQAIATREARERRLARKKEVQFTLDQEAAASLREVDDVVEPWLLANDERYRQLKAEASTLTAIVSAGDTCLNRISIAQTYIHLAKAGDRAALVSPMDQVKHIAKQRTREANEYVREANQKLKAYLALLARYDGAAAGALADLGPFTPARRQTVKLFETIAFGEVLNSWSLTRVNNELKQSEREIREVNDGLRESRDQITRRLYERRREVEEECRRTPASWPPGPWG